jgi:hypothetical protein
VYDWAQRPAGVWIRFVVTRAAGTVHNTQQVGRLCFTVSSPLVSRAVPQELKAVERGRINLAGTCGRSPKMNKILPQFEDSRLSGNYAMSTRK